MRLNKKYLVSGFLSIAIFGILLSAGGVFGKEFEVRYPDISGIKPISGTKDALPMFVKYLFYAGIALAGFIAFGAAIYGGVRYITSDGNPSSMEDAKSQMLAGLLGVVLLLGSVMLLNTINPQLTILSLEGKPLLEDIAAEKLPGVYLKSDSTDNKIHTIGSISNLSGSSYNFNDKTKSISLVTSGTTNYRAVLHEDYDYRGQCKYFLSGSDVAVQGKTTEGNVDGVSSVTVIASTGETTGLALGSDFSIKLCKTSIVPTSDDDLKKECQIVSIKDFMGPIRDFPPENVENEFNDNIYSMEVAPGNTVLLFERTKDDGGWPGKCEAFGPGLYPELRKHYIGRCHYGGILGFGGSWKSCVSSYALIIGEPK